MAANESDPPREVDRAVDPRIRPRWGRRYAQLRLSIGRHPTDVIRMAVAAGLVLACLVAARSREVNPVEAAIFSELERLPSWSSHGWEVLRWFGSWPGIAVAAGLSLYLGRVRMAMALTASGVVSWVLALLIYWLVGPRPVPLALLPTLLRQPGPGGFQFPDARVAVIAALVTAAGPYLTRLSRDTGWILVVLVAAADVFLGHNLPLDTFAGGVLGWGTGTLFHLVIGAPGRRTSEVAVRLALGRAGLNDACVTAVRRQLLRPQEYDVVTCVGDRLQMKVVRRMHRLAGPWYKLRRALASLEVEHEPGLSTPRHEVEHEAYVTLLAERAGVGTVPVLLAGEIEHGPPFLIRRYVEGRRLSTLARGAIADALLDDIWADVMALGAEHIAHHDLRAVNILVDSAGHPRIVDFTFSRVGGPSGQGAQDAAEMLVSLASVVGVKRAVSSAVRSLPRQTLQDALPYLQWLALHRRMRKQLGGGRVALTELRECLADRIGAPIPPFRSPVRPATVAILLAGGLAVYLLLPQLSSMNEVLQSLSRADWRWLVAAAASGLLAIPASALTVLGSSRAALPIGKTVAVQVAAAFTGRTTAAGIGFYGINLVYLERLGLRRTHAVGVLVLNRAVVGLISAVATVLGILAIGKAAPVGQLAVPTGWQVLGGAALLVVAVAAFLWSPFGRRRVWQPLVVSTRELVRELLPTLRQPIRAAQLFGGSVVFLALSAAGLAATLAAFAPSFPVVPVFAVFVVGSTLGQLAPTPGGLGAVEGALVAGLTAIGVSSTDAVAAVLASRALTFWLPVLPGLVAFRLLQHRDIV
ncbi:MAG: lysylphosphatidylglycerol synthase domain-containing protein [Nocardioidaceae bacterium]